MIVKSETEFEFCLVKQNTVEEYLLEFECSVVDVGKKSTSRVAFLSSVKPQLAQYLQYVISLLFHSLSMGNSSKIITKFKFSRLLVWITSVPLSVERIAPFVKKDRRLERARGKN